MNVAASTRAPRHCAFCGEPLGRGAAVEVRLPSLPGRPSVAWHADDGRECSTRDDLADHVALVASRRTWSSSTAELKRRELTTALLAVEARGPGRVRGGAEWGRVVAGRSPALAVAPPVEAVPLSVSEPPAPAAAAVRPRARCSAPGCDAAEVWSDGLCNEHRRAAMTREAHAFLVARCVHLSQRPSEWLQRYGGEAGFARWAEEAQGRPWARPRTHEQLRREWRTAEARARKDAPEEGWQCGRGHDDRSQRDRVDDRGAPYVVVARDDLGPVLSPAGEPLQAQSPIYCLHQRCCRDYVAVDAVLERLARRPQGRA